MAFFILMMVGIQFSSFLLDIYWNMPISPSIANTAHLSGALCGFVLGRLPFFHWKTT
jgi:GlpG protein